MAVTKFGVDTKLEDCAKHLLIFAKIHVKWATLLQIAEVLHFEKPIVRINFINLCRL